MHILQKPIATFLVLACTLLIGSAISSQRAFGLEEPGKALKEVGLTTERGTQLDTSVEFVDIDGQTRSLASYLSPDRPTIIVPAYYTCPRLCGLLLSGVKELLEKLNLSLGEDYRVVAVSFNPKDTPKSASKMRHRFVDSLPEKVGNPSGWSFLSGSEENIALLMSQLGFHYKKDKGEFAHTAAIFITTPQGLISQYYTGISFPYRDVRLSLVEAGKGEIGTVIDHVLLYCFRFDPTQGKYTWAAFNVMRAGGGLTLVLLAGLIFWLRKREKNAHAENS